MRKIHFDRVSKQFMLKHERPRSFQELFLNAVHLQRSHSKEKYWALSETSFEVSRGAMVGIIGPNGAGKSTIMKLVSRIIEPTSGQIEVVGRVGALLELGAGFHPDLTGRENIYLNGSILGLRRREITKLLDAIISFAELEQFIDIPVKHYSSGMFVRLGFSVAVHTRPDILLIDEVLAVGDAGFQQKCLEKIAEFRRSGCTIVYVSHNSESVRQLCSEVIWLDHGRIKQMGDPDQVVSRYVASVGRQTTEKPDLENKQETETKREPGDLHSQRVGMMDKEGKRESGDLRTQPVGIMDKEGTREPGDLRIQRVGMMDKEGKPQWTFGSGETVLVHIEYESRGLVENPVFSILFHRSDGLYVSSTNTYNIDPLEFGPINGLGTLVVEIDSLNLHSGEYLLSVGAYRSPDPPHWSAPAHFLDKQFKFRVVSEQRHGIMVMPARWKHTVAGNES